MMQVLSGQGGWATRDAPAHLLGELRHDLFLELLKLDLPKNKTSLVSCDPSVIRRGSVRTRNFSQTVMRSWRVVFRHNREAWTAASTALSSCCGVRVSRTVQGLPSMGLMVVWTGMASC